MNTTRILPKASLITRALLVAAAHVGLQAQTVNVIDGEGGTGIMLFEGSHVYGDADTSTVYTNYFTEGGAGSGGGAGLGGVFFVNSGATLTLNNVSFKSNTIKGGEGGSPPPVSVGGFAMAVTERVTVVAEVPDMAATAHVVGTYGSGNYTVEKVTLNTVSPTYKVGFAAGIDGTTGISSIASISGKDVTFAQPLQVAASAIYAAPAEIAYTAGATTITNLSAYTGATGVTNDPVDAAHLELSNALFVGRVLVGDGFAPGTKIIATKTDDMGRVIELTLNKPTLAAGSGFDVIKVETFSAAQFKPVSNTQVEANAKGLGLAVGMYVTGEGVPEGTRVVSIDPIPGSNNSVVTFSQDVNAGANTLGFEARLPVLGETNNVLRLSGGDPRLVAGMKITGDGIAAGTTITAIDLAAGTITLSQDVLDTPSEFKVSNVSDQSGAALTLLNVGGLSAGMLVTGENVPDGTTVVSVVGNVVTLSQAPTGEILGLTAISPLNIGGSLNGITHTGTVGANGKDGYSGRPGAAFLMEGEGQDGTNGYYAKDGTAAHGGNGGAGGNGSNGIPFNWALSWEIASLSFDLGVTISEAVAAATNVDESDPLLPHPDPDFGEMGVKIAAASIIAVDLGTAITNLTLWSIDMSRGLVARGGAGGDGGAAGNGDEFFGGGTGGAGGRGGEGGASWTDGGDGGSGGSGGSGGFGAGGGTGGAAGKAGSTGQGVDGDAGDGGSAGFGAGVGTSGDGTGGGGGSGFGGAIFIRTGGTVTLTGDSVFENNATLGGSSNNGGSAGQAAGTDIFLMKGAELYIAPGAGHTIRLEGTIADDSAASIDGGAPAAGYGATVRFGGGGLVQLNGENTYTGTTQIEGATLAVVDGVGIHKDSHILFAGAGRIGSLTSGANTGSLLLDGLFVRRVGTLPHQLSWAGSGGFSAASEEGLVLNFGRISGTTGQVLRWNTAGISDDSVIVFGSEYGQGSVHLLNAVNMNGSTGKFAAYGIKPEEGAYAAAHTAYLEGFLSNGSIEIGSAGMDGLIILTADNELTGATVNSGTVTVLGRLFKPGTGGNLSITNNGQGAGTVFLWNDELVNDLSVAAGGELTALADVTANAIDNSGTINLGGSATARSVVNRSGGEIKVLGGLTVLDKYGYIENQSGATVIQSSDITAETYVTNNGQWTVVGTPTDGAHTLKAVNGLSGSGTITLSRSVYDNGADPDITVDAALTLDVGPLANADFSGVIEGEGSLTKAGISNQTLSGDNTFTGDLTVAAGTLILTGTQDDAVDIIVRSGATLDLGADDTVASVTVDNGGLTYLDADITATGNYANNGRTAAIGSRTLTLGGGLTGSGSLSAPNIGTTLTVSQDGNTTYSGSITGLGGFTKDGDGTLTLNGGANSLATGGVVTVDGGVLALDGAGILSSTANVVINADGTLRLVSGNQVANSIAGTGTIDLGLGNTLEVNTGTNFTGNVTGNGVLKVAGGSMNVSNVSSTSGTFNVSNGATTNINNGGSLTFPNLVVDPNSTLHLGASGTNPGNSTVNVSGTANIYGTMNGSGTINGNAATHSGSTLAPGNSPGVINYTGNLDIGSGTNVQMELQGFLGAGVNPGGHDQIQVGGDLTISTGATLDILQLSGLELGRGQALKIFSFTPGRVSGHFGTATSELTNPVFLSLATGNVVGYGPGGRAALLAAIAPNANQASMLTSTLVETNGGVDQVYGGRLLEALAAAVQLGGSTDAVFALSSAERHGSLLAQGREMIVGAIADLPADSDVQAAGWGVRAASSSADSVGSEGEQLGYKVSRNSGIVQYTTVAPAGAVTFSLGIHDTKTSASGYTAEGNGQSLALAFQRRVESVSGLAFSLRAGLARQDSDTTRSTLGAVSNATNVGSQSVVVGAGLGYTKAFEGHRLNAGVQLLGYRVRVDAFEEGNVSSYDALSVGQQEDNGAALVATVGLSSKVTENLSLGADLGVTSFGGSKSHAVDSSVLGEGVRSTVMHEATGSNLVRLGLSAAYQLDPKSSINLGVSAEGDAGLSGGFRADLGYRVNF